MFFKSSKMAPVRDEAQIGRRYMQYMSNMRLTPTVSYESIIRRKINNCKYTIRGRVELLLLH